MFTVQADLQPARDVLRELRNAVIAAREDVTEAVQQGVIRDHIETDVSALIAPYPERTTGDFIFATARSRRWYLTAMRTGFFSTQSAGLPWTRTGTLQEGWKVAVNSQFAQYRAGSSTITIYNDAVDEKGSEYAAAVYGPNQVPGFADIGWGDNIESAIVTITDHVTEDLLSVLDTALAQGGFGG